MNGLPRYSYGVTSIVMAALFAGCSGGTASMTPPAPQTPIAAPSHKKHGKARIVVRIPLKKKGAGRRAQYISPSTKSMTVAVAGGNTSEFDLTATSPNCGTNAVTDFLTCTEGTVLPAGQQTLTVVLYDQIGGKGSRLSTAQTSVAVAPTGFTRIPITLGGIVAKASVLVNGSAAATVPIGTPTSLPVTVQAYDADNNLIVPPGNYTTPITLTNSDASGVASFTAPGSPATRKTGRHIRKPKDATPIIAPGTSATLYYNGNGGDSFTATLTPSVNASPQPNGAATMTTTGTPVITEYPIPADGSGLPYAIANGPDGALWFTEESNNPTSLIGFLGRITTDGVTTSEPFAVPNPGNPASPFTIASSEGLTTGSDGALWVASPGTGQIGRLATGGAASLYDVPLTSVFPLGITAGPDGALWFTNAPNTPGAIGRITTDGTITMYATPTVKSKPEYITTGPDGALWFTENLAHKIGRITTAGTITEFPIASGNRPIGIAAGADGALWFTELQDQIGRITTTGTVTEYALPAGSGPTGIAAGPDGALWFVDNCVGNVGRITTNGVITGYTIPTSGSGPEGITAGPDGALWFTEAGANQIGRLP